MPQFRPPPPWSGRAYREPPPGRIKPRPKMADVFGAVAQHVIELATAEKPFDFARIYGNDHPVALEIGPGGGEFLIGMAQTYPGINFMAIEQKCGRVKKIAKKVERAGLTNARLLWAEAAGTLTDFLAPGTLSALYVNFPDPWSKRRHRRRRLVQLPFVDTVKTVLKPGGEITFVTDVEDYAREALALFEGNGFTNAFGTGTWIDRIDGYIETVFERRWRAEGRSIHSTRFRRP